MARDRNGLIIFSSGINRQGFPFCWYRVQQEDAYCIKCGSSARMADIVCANEDQIRRHGRWNTTKLNGAYLTRLPREMMRPMADFPSNGRFFYLARASLDQPTSLCKKLFPAIDERHDRLAAKELSPDNNDPIHLIVAANAFVQVIMMVRKTFVQDSVLILELYPCHHIWQHSIFSDLAYFSFLRDLLQN